MAFNGPSYGAVLQAQEQLDEPARHQGGKFRCPACGAEFDTQEQLDEHAKTVHNM